ncbi:MAG: hypothetical protein LC733_12270, partial [Actinobacteria bacterium]|nr:hypothetical protein [Actinomycetota bacterium]
MAASFAWACTAGAETLSLSSESGAAGQPVFVEGEGWTPGTIEVFLETATGNVPLGRSSVPSDSAGRPSAGRFRAEVTIPAGMGPGKYPIRVSSNGTFSKIAVPMFTVLAPAVQPIANPVPNPQPVTATPAADPALEQ